MNMPVLITRKDAINAGIKPSVWRRAREMGLLKPACADIYRRARVFSAAHVAQVFGLKAGWDANGLDQR